MPPQRLHHPVRRDHGVVVEEEQGEDRALAAALEDDGGAVAAELQAPQDVHPHVPTKGAPTADSSCVDGVVTGSGGRCGTGAPPGAPDRPVRRTAGRRVMGPPWRTTNPCRFTLRHLRFDDASGWRGPAAGNAFPAGYDEYSDCPKCMKSNPVPMA